MTIYLRIGTQTTTTTTITFLGSFQGHGAFVAYPNSATRGKTSAADVATQLHASYTSAWSNLRGRHCGRSARYEGRMVSVLVMILSASQQLPRRGVVQHVANGERREDQFVRRRALDQPTPLLLTALWKAETAAVAAFPPPFLSGFPCVFRYRGIMDLNALFVPSHGVRALFILYHQYFEQERHPLSTEALLAAAKEAGIDEKEAKESFADEYEGLQDVKMVIRVQASNGIDSVPNILIEGERRDFTLEGAKEVEEYLKTLEQVAKESS